MTGIKHEGIVLQDRDRHLMRELATMRVIDREQAKCAAGFMSTRRANSRLLTLTRAGLLRRFFLGTRGGGQKALYALSPTGAKLVDVPFRGPRRAQNQVLVADFFVTHQLSINQIYCVLKFEPVSIPKASFGKWQSFYEPLESDTREQDQKRSLGQVHCNRSISALKPGPKAARKPWSPGLASPRASHSCSTKSTDALERLP